MYKTKAVIIAMIITAVVSISVTIFCFQTKVRALEGQPLPGHPIPLSYTDLTFWAWHSSRPGRAQILILGVSLRDPKRLPFTLTSTTLLPVSVLRMPWSLPSAPGGSTEPPEEAGPGWPGC